VAEPDGVLGTIFDLITTGSPLKTKPVREAVKAIGGFLLTVPEPEAKAFGGALVGLVRVFEKRDEIKKKKRR